jgi:FkbM family methyltransferase
MFIQPKLKKMTTPNRPPIDTIVHLGAGRCSELDDYLAQQPHRLLLVEADPQLAEDLQNRTKGHESVQVSCAAISGQPGPATFNRYNLPEVNSLHAANKLIELFPGLKTVEQLKVNAISPDSLLSHLKLNVEQKNLLIIDLPGEELPVLQVLKQSQKLHFFSQVILHCGCESLYEGSEAAEQVLEWLRDEGFDLVAEDNSINPDRPCWTLRRNDMQLRNHELQDQVEQLANNNRELKNNAAALHDRVETLSKKLDVQKKLSKEQKTQIEQLTKERDEHAKFAEERQVQLEQFTKANEEQAKRTVDLTVQLEQLTLAKDELTGQEAERQNLLDLLKQKLDESTKKDEELRAEIQQLAEQKETQAKLAHELKGKIEQLKKERDEKTAKIKMQQTDHSNMRKGLESVFKKEILNATKQMEAYLGVLHYLQSGEFIGDMHNWPVSPDFALYLIQLLEFNDYDLVIEFGSGTSTVLIAKTLKKIACRRQGKQPAQQLSFEHLGEYHTLTYANLQQAGLAESVQLIQAPLVPYTAPNGNIYSYYNCHQTLSELANCFSLDGLKILVMVDGPPATTGEHARYPAVPSVLNHCLGARIDILLDDYIRSDEKEIVQLWLSDIEAMGLEYTIEQKKMEKDACLIRVLH